MKSFILENRIFASCIWLVPMKRDVFVYGRARFKGTWNFNIISNKNMKFRGKMCEILCIKQFSNIVASLAKLSKKCVIRIAPDQIIFTISDEGALTGKPVVWCYLEQTNFFNEYNMVGVSDTHNLIYLEFSPDLLARATASLRNSTLTRSVKMKLTNKKSPCLTIEIELLSQTHSRICIHDIPVEVIPRRQWITFQEPKIPDFDVSIEMPNLKLVRNVVDRMKNLGLFLIVSANCKGMFHLKVETDRATTVTHFKDLTVDHSKGSGEPEKFYSVRVDVKKFAQVLVSELVHPNKIQCGILGDRTLHVLVEHENVTLQYFLPSVNL